MEEMVLPAAFDLHKLYCKRMLTSWEGSSWAAFNRGIFSLHNYCVELLATQIAQGFCENMAMILS